ncbi:hypothetical protein P872_24210 [Rhodonellum psychrophilum GCM71 = DSM 17998]|uniref:Cyclic nucleotide-binding domain-containing protein n=2 Tax=Rhodonellum TaxID=336827 RepID=U5C6E9_9BACT|nr:MULTISPECIES: Crp/Fnr family transcriptional regulator [Rhodonellum]ERM84526.1 hypothetical protein P872_24210 [Rhodonellum psychrophilum GCM71 = DSM 17998]SDY84331.1 cAMP-binding domain of CRP or a regulatory subunit of cAMP-dependent protein kinases [Rhodonellum ikkaensis]
MDLKKYILEEVKPQHSNAVLGVRRFQKGEYIYMPPTKPNEVFQMVSGVVKIGSYTIDGDEVCYDFLFRQEVFGNLSYLNGQFFEFAKAVTDCELTTYDLSFYKKIIVHDHLVSEWFNRMVVSRWCKVETKLFKICTLSPMDRILSLFQEMDQKIEDSNGKFIHLPSLMTDLEISQLTGLTRQTVAKLLKSYQRVYGMPLFKTKKIKSLNNQSLQK